MNKSFSDRVAECVRVLKEMRECGIDAETRGYAELKSRMDDYIKTGDPWKGRIPFPDIERVAVVLLPRPARSAVEVTLRKNV